MTSLPNQETIVDITGSARERADGINDVNIAIPNPDPRAAGKRIQRKVPDLGWKMYLLIFGIVILGPAGAALFLLYTGWLML